MLNSNIQSRTWKHTDTLRWYLLSASTQKEILVTLICVCEIQCQDQRPVDVTHCVLQLSRSSSEYASFRTLQNVVCVCWSVWQSAAGFFSFFSCRTLESGDPCPSDCSPPELLNPTRTPDLITDAPSTLPTKPTAGVTSYICQRARIFLEQHLGGWTLNKTFLKVTFLTNIIWYLLFVCFSSSITEHFSLYLSGSEIWEFCFSGRFGGWGFHHRWCTVYLRWDIC